MRRHYLAGRVVAFNIGDFVTSGDGMNFLTQGRQSETEGKEAQEAARIGNLLASDRQRILSGKAQRAAWQYYDTKAWTEEMNDGTQYTVLACCPGRGSQGCASRFAGVPLIAGEKPVGKNAAQKNPEDRS